MAASIAAPATQAITDQTRTDTFSFVGDALQSATAPEWATQAQIELHGGRVGGTAFEASGGTGANLVGVIAISAGEKLRVGVGGAGGSNTGDEGGAG